MRSYLLVILGTLFAMNMLFMAVSDVKKKFFEPTHAELADKHNFTDKVKSALPEMADFTTYLYHAFVGWKAGAVRSQYFNISADGVRKTIGNPESYTEKVYVFGGSTTWGYGLPDGDTIPSHMQKLMPNRMVINKAEISYNATQELNSLLVSLARNEIDKNSTIVFFDGVNEIYHSCALGSTPYGHGREREIRKVFAERPKVDFFGLFDTLFLKFTWKAAEMVKAKFASGKRPASLCGSDDKRAWEVARRLVTSWQAAYDIATARGLRFRAILQPNPYSDQATKRHFHSDEFDQGTRAVYPKVLQLAAGMPWFVDGTKWLQGKDLFFDACCHVNEKGNAVLARNIVDQLPTRQASLSGPVVDAR